MTTLEELPARFDASFARFAKEIDVMLEKRLAERFRVEGELMDERFESLRGYVDERFVGVYRHLDGIDRRLDGIDSRLDGIDSRLDGVDGRFDAMDRRFDGIDGRLDGMDRRFDGIDGRLDSIDRDLKFLREGMKTILARLE